MRENRPFYFWTEFHAKYKGSIFLLSCIKQIEKAVQQKYIDITNSRMIEFTNIFKAPCDSDKKIYLTMSLNQKIIGNMI